MAYFYLKAIHVIFMVSWMAGLFYIVRLFVYHIEANNKPEPDRTILQNEFVIMEYKLWYYITIPAMVLTTITGALILYVNTALLQAGYIHVKLAFAAGLIVYHFLCQRILNQFKLGNFRWSSSQLRFWNEVATIFLVAISFTIIVKSAMQWVYGLVGLLIFTILILSAVRMVKWIRLKN